MSYPVSSQEKHIPHLQCPAQKPLSEALPRGRSFQTNPLELTEVCFRLLCKTALHRRSIPKRTVTNILYRWVLNIYKIKTRIMRPASNEQQGSVATFYAQISLNCGSTYQGQVEKKFKWTEVQSLWWSIHCITAIPFFLLQTKHQRPYLVSLHPQKNHMKVRFENWIKFYQSSIKRCKYYQQITLIL